MEQNGQGPAPGQEMLPGIHIVKGLRQSLSNDGRNAMMVFEIARDTDGNSRAAVTCGVDALRPLRGMVHALVLAADRMSRAAGMISFEKPGEIGVGHSTDIRGCVIMTFNAGAENEISYLIPDEIALGVADGLRNDVLSRMSEDDRRKMMTGAGALMLPRAPKLIVPGRG